MNAAELVRQHLIDPEICIRCNTCEETCPVHAIQHDARNYVVRFDTCENCRACIPPCPTGAIENYRRVARSNPYAIEDQFSWDELPAEAEPSPGETAELPADVVRITEIATAGQGGAALPPWSAAHPYEGLHTIARPAIATVTGNYRLTEDRASSDVHHIVLDFGRTACPVLEGQSLGVIAPGLDAAGKAHHVRLYSIASPRNGERPGYNNLALTVKRVAADRAGRPVHGVCSNYLCDLKRGDQVKVVGPYGTSFLMPNHPGSSLMMICTGTGSAPMRAMTERRRRRAALGEGGRLMLFFGARAPAELPYFGPLMKLPKDFIDINLAFSRASDRPKRYVQDLIRDRGEDVANMLRDPESYIYVCGLKGMETGVNEAFAAVCGAHGMTWDAVLDGLKREARFHVETY
ncbi:MAG: benzoyl-CoA 2,3-epoxidase subunit BoxA [Betaproteobacteria bacterium]|nr:benzoyl-CoA 2,3-epoxidase subunit BoxA [Betaproteobacteria bacterium]